jgi:ABC-type transport system involved in Fe-S cluster assembly fused permease/ATPase subunit
LILFNIIPTFIDIIVALVVFCIIFDWQVALVIFVVMFAYGSSSPLLCPSWLFILHSRRQCHLNKVSNSRKAPDE